MLLTLYYIAATWLQSNRIKNICNKITENLKTKSSIVFYNLPLETNGSSPATSDLCINRDEARISDILLLKNNQRGCSLYPMQIIHLTPWVTFPEVPNLIPFDYKKIEDLPIIDEENLVHLLLETDILPNINNFFKDIVSIEEYGKLLAWKIDSHLAILMQSDVKHFTDLIMSTFMQGKFYINDNLPLIRIESIGYEGSAQPFEQLKNHLRKQLTSRAMRQLSSIEWEKHISSLRSLSILANQATEFEYNKNRTEGKTGIIKSDLIPAKHSDTLVCEKSNTFNENIKKESPKRNEAIVSPLKQVPEVENHEQKIINIDLPLKTSKTNLNVKNEISDDIVNKTNPSQILVDKFPSPIKIKLNSDDEIKSKQQIATIKPIKKSADVVLASESKTNSSVKKLIKDVGKSCKPPNILVFSESGVMRNNVISILNDILEEDTYTIYPLTIQQVKQNIWMDNTSLLVVCGPVENNIGKFLVNYFLNGGKIFSLCSDILNLVLPTYRTTEVREHELVQFSYDKWQNIKMMHYVFCYQPSPAKKHFSNEIDEISSSSNKSAMVCPRSVEMKDLQGNQHSLDVKVLGTEETWNTPSLLLANDTKSGGKVIFSQIHLEADPCQYESDEIKYNVLRQSNKARLEIFTDLLKKYLNITVRTENDNTKNKNIFKPAYFLGRHELKFELLEYLKTKMTNENTIETANLTMKFCGKDEILPPATETFLPISIHTCPEDFSTVDYFDNLNAVLIGRLVIYAPVISTSMSVINDLILTNGIVVIPKYQTNGSGRNNNRWISREGSAMFSLQLHIALDSCLGRRASLTQHLIATAIVNSICSMDGYENLEIGLKWPNDIYAYGAYKIGGIIVNTQMNPNLAICNIGCGLNLNNSSPTKCINDIIIEYNKNNNKNLSIISYEKFLANVFNEIEILINKVQDGDLRYLYELYYKYWLHGNQEITVMDKNGCHKDVKIIGIDEFGYLEVQANDGRKITVHPDGNSFDMFKGLIVPK